MHEQHEKEIQKMIDGAIRKWANESWERQKFLQDSIETRFHFVEAALMVLGVLVGFLLARALL